MRLKFIQVKTAKKRSNSSATWLRRQLNDEFVVKSKIDGYRSRAAYKLLEIDEKFRIIRKGSKVIDLGAAPGGWSQIVSNKMGRTGKIVAIDLLEMQSLEHVDFIQGDFCDPENLQKLYASIGGKADLILSDMAPNTTGHRVTDHIRIIDLCERVMSFAEEALAEGGSIVLKIFQGGAQGELFQTIRSKFKMIKHFKPESSRKDSSEMYLVAKGYITTPQAELS